MKRFSYLARTPALGLAILLSVGAVAPGALGSPAYASGVETEPRGTVDKELSFGAFVEVQLVNVDLWVTDAKGQPVVGLAPSDFEVLEDGGPVEVSHFGEVRADLGLLRSQPLAQAGPEALEETGLEVQEATTSAESPAAHLVLYFDEARLPPSGRKRLMEDLREFVASGTVRADHVLILRQADDLFIEAPFGASTAELDAALSRLAPPSALGARAQQELRLAVRRLQDLWTEAQLLASNSGGSNSGSCAYFLPRAIAEVERTASERTRSIYGTLDHLESVTGYLSALSGVKTLVYLGNALETLPGAGLMGFVDDVCPAQQESTSFALVNRELSESFRALTRHANANQVTIYSLQTGGLQTSFLGAAEQGAVDLRGSSRFEITLRENARGGLSYLAAETGGRAIFNTNRFLDELSKIGREMSGYYSLAYEPPHGGDGGEHRIDVKVRGYGFRVRNRRGYRDKDADERMAERLEGALYLGLVANPLAARLGASEILDAGNDSYGLPFHIMVPVDKITFLAESSDPGEAQVGLLKVMVSARDARNQSIVSHEKLFRIERPASENGGLVDLVLPLELQRSLYVVAAAIRDEATGETSFVSTTLALAAESEAESHPARDG